MTVIDTANCIGTRPQYFSTTYDEYNNLQVGLEDDDTAISVKENFLISVNGQDKIFDFSFLRWNAATDFESGVSRTVSTNYWLYITEEGAAIISDQKPYNESGFLKGWYHPYNSWRCVAQLYNNAANDFELIKATEKAIGDVSFSTRESVGKNSYTDRVTIANGTTTAEVGFRQGKFIFDDGSGQTITPGLLKRLDAAWAPGNQQGGLDTGTVADGTYFCFSIYKPGAPSQVLRAGDDYFDYGTTEYLFSLSPTAPTMPTGYTKKEYVGAIIRDSGAILDFEQYDRDFMLVDASLDGTGAYSATTNLTLQTPIGIITKAYIDFWMQRTSGVSTFLWCLRSGFQNAPAQQLIEGTEATTEKQVSLYTDASSQIVLDKNSSGFNIADSRFYTTGWKDINLR